MEERTSLPVWLVYFPPQSPIHFLLSLLYILQMDNAPQVPLPSCFLWSLRGRPRRLQGDYIVQVASSRVKTCGFQHARVSLGYESIEVLDWPSTSTRMDQTSMGQSAGLDSASHLTTDCASRPHATSTTPTFTLLAVHAFVHDILCCSSSMLSAHDSMASPVSCHPCFLT